MRNQLHYPQLLHALMTLSFCLGTANSISAVFRDVIVPEDLDAGTHLMRYMGRNFTHGTLSARNIDGVLWTLISTAPLIVELSTNKRLTISQKKFFYASFKFQLAYPDEIAFICKLHPRKLPQMTSTNLYASVDNLFVSGVTISTTLSVPATALQYVNVSTNSTDLASLGNPNTTIHYTSISLVWSLPNQTIELEDPITAKLTIEDNGDGKYVRNGTTTTRAAGNGKSTLYVTIYPIPSGSTCLVPNFNGTPIANVLDQPIYVKINDTAHLMMVKYSCNVGYYLIGPGSQVCLGQSTLSPAAPPTECRAVTCRVSDVQGCAHT
eukprot:scpid90767/ scgid22355/ 